MHQDHDGRGGVHSPPRERDELGEHARELPAAVGAGGELSGHHAARGERGKLADGGARERFISDPRVLGRFLDSAEGKSVVGTHGVALLLEFASIGRGE